MNNRLVVVRGRALSAAQDLAQEHVALVGRLGRLQQLVVDALLELDRCGDGAGDQQQHTGDESLPKPGGEGTRVHGGY